MLAQKAGHVGILGGTFNPIHYGHIELGVQALEQFRLDKVLVMPNNKPGYKDISNEVTTDHRVNMIKLAIDGIKGWSILILSSDVPGSHTPQIRLRPFMSYILTFTGILSWAGIPLCILTTGTDLTSYQGMQRCLSQQEVELLRI